MDTAILSRFPINVIKVRPYKAVHFVEAQEGCFALKEIKFPEEEFNFIYRATEHLVLAGFKRISRFVPAKDGRPFGEFNGKRYSLSHWVMGREANYEQKTDVDITIKTMASLHYYSQKFSPPAFPGRIKWGTWPDAFRQRRDQMIQFRTAIEHSRDRAWFDQIFLAHVAYYLDQSEQAIEIISRDSYRRVNTKDQAKGYFCHHDFAYHNVIVDSSMQGHLIDFDYCISDIRCHDLGSLMLRILKLSDWNENRALYVLKIYDSEGLVFGDEIEVIRALLRFPQDFWQVAYAYYVEKNQPKHRLERKIHNWVLKKDIRERSLRKLETMMQLG